MGPESTVTSPDGRRWRVRRRWLERPLPNPRRHYKVNRKEATETGVIDGILNAPDLADSGASLALGIAILLVIFVVLPLLGVALELIILLFAIFSGVVARVVFGRPWIVEAVSLDDPEDQVTFAAQGWRQSSEALREVRAAIAATGPPDQIAAGKALATRRETP